MRSNWTAVCRTGLILIGLNAAVFAQAEKSDRAKSSPTRDQLKEAFRAANDGKFADAVKQIDAALRQAPEDRDALFLMALIARIGADNEATVPAKIALLKRSGAAYQALQGRYKPLTDQEKKLGDAVQLDRARVVALDGKPDEALGLLTQMGADGSGGVAMIDVLPDFDAVRKLPSFATSMAEANRKAVRAMLADFNSFPFDFSLKTVDGVPVKLSDFRGKVTIVDVWGTWCPPCRKEIPHFIELVDRFDAKGLKIVGINCNEEGSPAEVKKTIDDFVAANKIPYPCVLNDDTITSKIPDFRGYPTTLFLDRTGKVRFSEVGYQPMARLEAIVTTLLAEPNP